MMATNDIPLLLAEATGPGRVERFVKFLAGKPANQQGCSRWLPKFSPALVVLAVALVATLLAAGPLQAFGFAAATVSPDSAKAFAPTPATPRAYAAYEAFSTAFPRWLAQDNEVFFIESTTDAPVVSEEAEKLCASLQAQIAALGSPALLGTTSYYSALYSGLPEVAEGFVSVSNRSMIVVMQVDTTDAAASTSLVESGITIAQQLDAESGALSVILTGRLTTAAIDATATGLGFALGDGIGLPFIVLIFLWRVRSAKLLLLPACALGASLLWSYAVGKALCTVLPVPSFQPNIMLFLCLAFSIDYSFFLLTRFQEERQVNQKPLDEAVVCMMRHGGEVVFVSGGLLCLTWLALALFPVDGLNAIGYCSAIAVFFCVLSNLVIAPSMLLAFPDFFSRTSQCCCCRCCDALACCTARSKPAADAPPPWSNCYHRLAQLLTRPLVSVLVPLAVFGLMAFGASALGHLSLVLGVQFSVSNSTAAQAYATVQATPPFSQSGIFATPFAVLVQSGAGQPIFSADYFNATCALAATLQNIDGVVPYSLQGIAFDLDASVVPPRLTCLDVSTALDLVAQRDAPYLYRLRELSNVAANTSQAPEDYLAATASAITFAPSFNPFTSRSVALVDDVYAAIDATAPPAGGGVFSLFHPVVSEVAAEQYTVQRLPWVLGGTLAICFLLIALTFRAAIVPFKLLLTVGLPIAFVFGLAVCVYQDGALNWLGVHAFTSDGTGGISWLLPASTIFLLTGLALDYDIFLFARAYELRASGMSDRDAICRAVGLTGPVISSAGVIMALAFAGMVVGSNKYLNEFGFVMIVGVLLDTFVVRTVLVPCVLSLGGGLNWWPGRMPAPTPEPPTGPLVAPVLPQAIQDF